MAASSHSPAQEHPAHLRPMRGWRRSLFLLELLVCLGFCAVMALGSLLTLVPAIVQVLQKVFGLIAPVDDVPWRYAVQPIFLSVGSLAGLFALHDVARTLLAGRAQLTYSRKVVVLLALSGVAAVVVVGMQVIPQQPTHVFAFFCVYAPLLATAHIALISRRLFL